MNYPMFVSNIAVSGDSTIYFGTPAKYSTIDNRKLNVLSLAMSAIMVLVLGLMKLCVINSGLSKGGARNKLISSNSGRRAVVPKRREMVMQHHSVTSFDNTAV
jgi:hypothetical protein